VREIAENFAENCDICVLLHAENLQHGTTALLHLRRRGSKAKNYFALKIRRIRPGLKPRNRLPKATEAAEIMIGNAYYFVSCN